MTSFDPLVERLEIAALLDKAKWILLNDKIDVVFRALQEVRLANARLQGLERYLATGIRPKEGN